jgi:hypothetical protein
VLKSKVKDYLKKAKLAQKREKKKGGADLLLKGNRKNAVSARVRDEPCQPGPAQSGRH